MISHPSRLAIYPTTISVFILASFILIPFERDIHDPNPDFSLCNGWSKMILLESSAQADITSGCGGNVYYKPNKCMFHIRVCSSNLPSGPDRLYQDRHGQLVSHGLRDGEYAEAKHENRHNADI